MHPDTSPAAPNHLVEVIDGLAVNTAMPPALVRRLFAWRRGGGNVAGRPDLTDEMIAEIIAIDDHWLVHSLALNRQVPDRFRIQLAAHRDSSIRAALAARAKIMPREALELLIADPDRSVREELAQNLYTPPDLRARLADDPDPLIRHELARCWNKAPEDVRRRLLTDPDPMVRAAACSTRFARRPHPIPPADLVPGLLADPVTRAGAVAHAVLDADTLRLLAEDPNPEVRGELARRPDLPAEYRDRLAVDPDFCVRVKVFARADTPDDVRAQIYAAVMEPSPATYDAWLDLRILELPWVTADPLPHIDSPYVCFRISAAYSKTLPADAVARLLADGAERVRLTMAETAAHLVDPVTAETIERSYRGRDKFTFWWDRAEVLTFAPEALRRFATDPEPRLRSFAPRDPDLPAELAGRLASDEDRRVRRAVAGHRNLPLAALLQLLDDPCEAVAEAAAASPYLPVEHMERLLLLAGL